MQRRPRSAVVAAVALVASATPVRAHEVGGTRFDAPLPLSLLFVGAAATVAATAGWLTVAGWSGGTAGAATSDRAAATTDGAATTTDGTATTTDGTATTTDGTATASGTATTDATAPDTVATGGSAPGTHTTDGTVTTTDGTAAAPGTAGATGTPADPGRRWPLWRLPAGAVATAETAARVGFLLVFLWVVLAGLAGSQVPTENVATVLVWSVWLKGLAFVAATFGSPWRVLSPWRTAYLALERIEGDQIAVLGSYPRWLGDWPALVGFLAWLGVVENLTVLPRSPRATAALLAGYAALMVAGGVAFGRRWFDRADALAVLYRLFGRVAPLGVTRERDGDGYVLFARRPWLGSTRPVRTTVLAAFVVGAVYTVSFDGFASTPEYRTLTFALRDAAGVGWQAGPVLYLGGFLAFVAVFAAVASGSDVAGGGDSWSRATRQFAPTMVPIAVAYEVAHNYPFVAGNLGQSATFLGAAAPVDPLAWLSLPAFWASQVLLVVAGHVVAVVAAHGVAVRRYPTRRAAARAHAPLAALMVGYTVVSLWIVSRPVVS